MRRYILIAGLLIAAGGAIYGAVRLMSQPDPVTLTAARAAPGGSGTAFVFVTFETGRVPNRLISVSSPDARAAELVGNVSGDLVLPAGSTPALSSDGVYVKLSGVEGPLDEGRLIPVRFVFEPSGVATTRARIEPPSDPHEMHRMMGHMPATVPAALSGTPPEIAMRVSQSSDGGWTIALETAHFTFAPEVENPVHVPGEGHGHLYLNGLKLQRVYETSLTIGALPQGRHELVVSLNTNTHQAYVDANGPVEARAVIEVD